MERSKERDFIIYLTESAVMLALAFLLSFLKVLDLPYGGSVTLASMLPIVIIAYRHGVLKGFFSGAVFGLLQLLTGASALSYATTPFAAAAIICFDFILAFALCGFAGFFRKMKNKNTGLVLGALSASVTRYLCHVITGATVWAGLSIPDSYAVKYSFVYNATYMIPEAIVLVTAAFYVSLVLDLSQKTVGPNRDKKSMDMPALSVGALCVCAFIVYSALLVFSKLQDPDTGNFNICGISNVPILNIVIAFFISAMIFAVFTVIRKIILKNAPKSDKK